MISVMVQGCRVERRREVSSCPDTGRDDAALRRYLLDPLERSAYRSAVFDTRRAPFQTAHDTHLVHSKTGSIPSIKCRD
jgi:hypothetical protein